MKYLFYLNYFFCYFHFLFCFVGIYLFSKRNDSFCLDLGHKKKAPHAKDLVIVLSVTGTELLKCLRGPGDGHSIGHKWLNTVFRFLFLF
jgi:hypothetical protein